MTDHKSMRPRPVCESISEMAEIVLPNDANPLNALLGGRLMHWIDLAGAMAAHRHSRQWVVTASIDHMDFLVPVRVGDLTFVAIDGAGNHLPVPPVVSETADEKRRYEDAGRRREIRQAEAARRRQTQP
jgi:acyl-CoA hydrolase